MSTKELLAEARVRLSEAEDDYNAATAATEETEEIYDAWQTIVERLESL